MGIPSIHRKCKMLQGLGIESTTSIETVSPISPHEYGVRRPNRLLIYLVP
jgi:hypothetical protein